MKAKVKEIKTFEELLKHEWIWVDRWRRPCHIAFIISMPARTVAQYLNSGNFYTTRDIHYRKKIEVRKIEGGGTHD